MTYTVNIEPWSYETPMKVVDFYDYTLREVIAKVREVIRECGCSCLWPRVTIYGARNKVVYCRRPRLASGKEG